MAHESITAQPSPGEPSPPAGAPIRRAGAKRGGWSLAEAGNTLGGRIFLRLLPSITDIAFLLPLYVAFALQGGARALLRDAGTALHILTGDWILAHHAVPQQDLYSFTKVGSPWWDWEWAWDIGAALIHRRFGLSGVVVANCLVLSLVFALLFRLIRRRSGDTVVAFLLTMLAVATSRFHWLARPHLVGWLFVILTLSLIERSRKGDRWALWLIPPLVLVWANFHGSFLIALMLLACYGLGELVDVVITGDARPPSEALRAAMRYAWAGLAALAASLVNPYGWNLHVHIVQYLLDSRLLDRIDEFKSTNFHNSGALSIELLLLLGVLAAVWCVAHRRWAEAIAILVFAHFALGSMRNIPVFAFVACGAIGASVVEAGRQIGRIPARAWLRRLVEGALAFGREMDLIEGVGRVHWLSVMGIVLIVLLFHAPKKLPAFQAEFDPSIFPAGGASFMAKEPIGRVFTSDQWGDYLLYRFYPKMRVFLDDRSDFYGADFADASIRIRNAQPDWRDLLAKYNVDTALLSPKDPLAAVLKISPEWRLVFDDHVALLFRRAGQPGP
jgi:hypothetical protein